MSSNESVSLADRIRQFAEVSVIEPGLAAGSEAISVRAGDVHAAMHLKHRMPAVCGALESAKFAASCDIDLVDRKGPRQGANAVFVFRSRKSRERRKLSESPVKRCVEAPASAVRQSVDNTGEGTVYLVSCVSEKRKTPAPARELYVSTLFSKARAFVEFVGAPWFILSAKHGLLHPDEVIAPYEVTLNAMPVADRRRWAEHVLEKLRSQPIELQHVVILAGARYREFLEPALSAMGIDVEVPMAGLRIGEQLSWLGRQIRNEPS